MSPDVCVNGKSALPLRALLDGWPTSRIPLGHGIPLTRYKDVDSHTTDPKLGAGLHLEMSNSNDMESHYLRLLNGRRAAPSSRCPDGPHMCFPTVHAGKDGKIGKLPPSF